MRLLICAGGTGGGVYPALAVLSAITREHIDPSQHSRQAVETLWVGSKGGMEARLVEREGIPFKAVPAAGVHGVGLRQLPRNLLQLARGVGAARSILNKFQPDVLFFTGGYVAVPLALAGAQIPTLLYVPDIEPGLALKILARFADCITITAEDSQRYFRRKNVVVTGYPVRANLGKWKHDAARQALDLSKDAPVLLVFGGSKGARSLNNAVLAILPALLKMAQVVHITGELDWPVVKAKRNKLAEAQAARYHAFPYLHEEMGAALAAADLAISRAGASTLGEYPQFGLPAILVPYPYAWRYQKVNADYLAERGAAMTVEDGNLSEQLLPTVKNLLEDATKLKSMREAAQRLSHPQAATEIGRQLIALAGKRR